MPSIKREELEDYGQSSMTRDWTASQRRTMPSRLTEARGIGSRADMDSVAMSDHLPSSERYLDTHSGLDIYNLPVMPDSYYTLGRVDSASTKPATETRS